MYRANYVVEDGILRRRSSFQEIGLDEGEPLLSPHPGLTHRQLDKIDEFPNRPTASDASTSDQNEQDTAHGSASTTISISRDTIASRTSQYPLVSRLTLLAVVLATVLSLAQNPWITHGQSALPVAEAIPSGRRRDQIPAKRADSPTDVCRRWSGQSAIVNGTLYYYGGRATTDQSQVNNTWNNDLVSLDLRKSWQIGTPSFSGLPQPSGPPAIANGYLWNSHTSLFLYGGEFSDSPITEPVAFSLWEYDISSSSWKEHSSPQTSFGTNSENAGQAVQQVAEGAGANMPSLGRGWYFGGHQDFLTTAGWSYYTDREYLRSFVEFTFPGESNDGVQGLSGGAGDDGVWRNITQAGIQNAAGFTERADGVLVYVPGFGKEGVLIALAGGTNDTFVRSNSPLV